MNMDCVVIGTNLKNRFEKLKICTGFLDKYDFTVKSQKDIEYFGSNLNKFLQNRAITKEINESHIFVKTLEKDWATNSIQGGKIC